MTGPVVVDIGIDSGTLTAETTEVMHLEGIDDVDAASLIDAVPFLALGLQGVLAARRWYATDDPAATILADTGRSSKDVLINAGVGWSVATVSGADVVAAPTTIATALVRQGWRRTRVSVQRSNARVAQTRRYLGQLSTRSAAPAN